MSRDLLALLVEATWASSAAILVVMLLRHPLRWLSGARSAYALWWLVPVALLAILLPAGVQVSSTPEIEVTRRVIQATPGLAAATDFDSRPWLLLAWLVGMVSMARVLWRQQRRFLRSLGPLRERDDGCLQSDAVAGLPAVIGWRARIVLPRDFEQRYDPAARALVLCHEQVHRRRGDLPVHALVSALRCLFWFNPLVHAGASRLRQDQELACDETVLRLFPNQRRAYGDALLKTELADHPLPVGCHWFGSHPLKERLTMLKRPLPNKTRWFAGFAVVAAITLAGGWTAWAAQPARAAASGTPAEGALALTMKVRINGKDERIETLDMAAGQARTFEYAQDGEAWSIVLTLTPMDGDSLFLDADITRDGASQGKPKMVFQRGKGAAIGIGRESPSGEFKGISVEVSVPLAATNEGNTPGGKDSARDDAARRDAALEPAAVPARVALANPPVDQPLPWKSALARWSGAPAAEAGC